MTVWNDYVVEYYTSGVWTAIPNLQSLTCTIGRKQLTDSWSASNATFVFRYPTGFASPLANLNIDVPIRFRTPNYGVGNPTWTGYIKDASVEWGIPYKDGVGQADYLIINAEDAFALWGRVVGDGLALTSGFVQTKINDATSYYGLTWIGNVSAEPVGASTVDSSFMDWTQKILNTVQGRPLNGYDNYLIPSKPPIAYILRNDYITNESVSFSDTLNDATHRIYDQLNFDSLADNYYTQVLVRSPGLADQTAERGAAPYRTLTVDTFSQNVSQMQDIANYVLFISQGQVIAPSSISAVSSGQHTQNLENLGDVWRNCVSFIIEIVFRGQTFYSRIEGSTITATPEETRITYYLSPEEANLWFVLDSVTSGVLDQNRLGLY